MSESSEEVYEISHKIFKRDKCKISYCKLQIALCGIKMNSKVPIVCQKNNLLLRVKFY